ncbi:MAG: ABC transporter ATP-binding protein [Firmicutes bacterium]|nr:ABC transporter ATP-binding protein [Bacillota bacterium]
MLKVEHIAVSYGEFEALTDVSFEVNEGELVTLLGVNGAGKTTTLRAISGIVPARSGTITYDGRPIHKLEAEDIVELGIVHVPEGRGLFGTLTVRENLELGAYTARARRRASESMEMVFQLFPVLKQRQSQLAGSLSGGEQQMCAIGRGLMARPRLLMIDEMSLGLAPVLVQKMFEAVGQIVRAGVSVLLVEQHIRHSIRIADRACVLEKGRTVKFGPARELADQIHFQSLYLGAAAGGGSSE